MPFDLDAAISLLFWLAFGFAVLWVVFALIGRSHRHAYNLSHAETSGSAVRPDFLSVDHAKRQAVLAARPTPGAAPAAPLSAACVWSRVAALATAAMSLLALAGKALATGRQAEQAVQHLGSLDTLWAAVAAHPVGVAVALAVIVVNVVILFNRRPKLA